MKKFDQFLVDEWSAFWAYKHRESEQKNQFSFVCCVSFNAWQKLVKFFFAYIKESIS